MSIKKTLVLILACSPLMANRLSPYEERIEKLEEEMLFLNSVFIDHYFQIKDLSEKIKCLQDQVQNPQMSEK